MSQPQEGQLRLRHPPIVEAVFDLFCSMPEGFDLQTVEVEARKLMRAKYPKVRQALIFEQSFNQEAGKEPVVAAKRMLRGFQFLTEDEKQIAQFRIDGFSYNRLAPYTMLDDYLPEIKATWELFCKVCKPTLVTRVGLRNINRILAKLVDGKPELSPYLSIRPHLPDEANLTFTGFINNHQAMEPSTNNHVNVILTAQPVEGGSLPVILDVEAYKIVAYQPNASAIWDVDLPSIRRLKDRVFKNTLSETCLKSFQPL